MVDRKLQGLRGAVALAVAAALVAGGCTYGSLVGAPGPAQPGTARYESDARQASLEVPPDLSRAGVRDAYPIPGAGAGGSGAASVLPEIPGMRLERDGLVRWLVVEAEPGDLWPGLREFWLRQGFSLEVDDPQVGVMETGWAEERVPLPVGGIRRALERVKRFAYTYAVRDRFRTRVERNAESGVTEIHVTHRGAHEVVRGDGYAWAPRPSDPALEAEMLGRLMLHLGRDEAPDAGTAVAADVGEPRVRVMDDPAGGRYIQLEEDFDRGWRLVRRALDRGGFTLVDLNRSDGHFLVRYRDVDAPGDRKRSWVGRLAFWRDRDGGREIGEAERRIVLERLDASATRIVVQDADGGRDTSETAARLLAVLAEHIE